MNMKELKKQLDPQARYKWIKDSPYSWRLVNSFTMKSVFGCEDRLSAELLTRKLRTMRFIVETPPGELK